MGGKEGMEKKYEEIQFNAGYNIDHAVKQLALLKERGKLVFGVFNGVKLYSDIDDMDSAYKKVTGKTKAEFDEERRLENEKYEEEKRKHEAAIPDLTKEWIEKGKKILGKQYHEKWEKCVPIRLGDLYRGMELGCCLDIVERLNTGCDLETVKKIIYRQGHSGMSFGLVCSMVKAFCDRGAEFVSYVK